MNLSPTVWPKVGEFIQALLGPKCLDAKIKSTFVGSLLIQMQTPDIHEVFSDKLATLKVDGERHILILYVEENLEVRTLAMRRNGQVLEAPEGTTTLQPGSTLKKGYFTILDCEFVSGVWLAFDCIVFRAIPQTTKQDFTKRYALLQKTFESDFVCSKIFIKPYFPVVAGQKDFTQSIVKSTLARLSFDVPYDGVVFQPTVGIYPLGQNMNLVEGRGLKWKEEFTLDLVPRRLAAKDVVRIHEAMYGKSTKLFTYNIRNAKHFGVTRPEYPSAVFSLSKPLYKLECVSDFSMGVHVNFTTVAFSDVPLCVSSASDGAVVEYEIKIIDGTFVPQERVVRADKSVHQANKARTVAGVLWQADFARSNPTSVENLLDVYIENPDKLPPRIQIENVSRMFPVGSPDAFISFDGFIARLPFGRFTDGGVEEHEFKMVQTKRPRPGNIFPSTLECNFQAPSFVDALHFDRIRAGICRKYNKHEPPVVTTIDFTVDDVRVTATERSVPTKSGLPLVFYETTGFFGVRKTPMDSQSYILDMPDVLKNSGYCFRMDSRKELPVFFSSSEFLPDNPMFITFMANLEEYHRSPRKRKGGVSSSSAFNAEQFKGYRLVDSQEFAKEVEKDVPVQRLRRTSVEPVRVGEKVQVEYQGRSTQIHTATVKAVRGNVVDVQYDYSVRTLTSYTSTQYVPLVVDSSSSKKSTVIRVKKRQTFVFPGFKVELTQTRTINNFKAGRERLHHLASHGTFNREIEVELLSSIRTNPEFLAQLKDVLASIFSFAGLDENSFLFNRIVTNPPTPALKEALEAYDRHLSSDREIDPIFVRASRGVARIVPESDFYSTVDVEVRKLFGTPSPSYDLQSFERIAFEKLSMFADRSDIARADCLKRRLLESVAQTGDFGQMHGMVRGAVQLAYNPAWKEESFWNYLIDRLRIPVVHEADEELITSMKNYLQKREALVDAPFLRAGLAFGDAVAVHTYLTSIRAWWDMEESALAWNDLLDYAGRYSNEVIRSMNFRGFDVTDAVFQVETLRAILKLSVVVGAVKGIREVCDESEIPSDLFAQFFHLSSLENDRRVYSRTIPEIDLSSLKNVRVVLEY